MAAPIRTLLLSTLYPSSVRPGHGIFVETRLRELLKDGQVASKVIAPVPWFPSANPRFGDYATLARTPAREQHNGIDVLHPRFLVAPKVGMNLAPFALAATALRSAKKLLAEGFDFDTRNDRDFLRQPSSPLLFHLHVPSQYHNLNSILILFPVQLV